MCCPNDDIQIHQSYTHEHMYANLLHNTRSLFHRKKTYRFRCHELKIREKNSLELEANVCA